ncbi:DUF2272 domain-containing protein [Brevundimonas sp. 2R-24]|uniref:DUF2272 domain-containing protein n=1 Tax=Peiella sedimenti TaxID=3061083 RepID=A0ABT8SI09_9CAUL|nr:DUF2272 domain-containing protein [Caulobacteraceae bacterium XZ-24]
MRAALILLAIAGAAQAAPRLPREAFDVIPPSERVTGPRGDMRVVQSACRTGPTSWARRRIVDVAAQEWAFFGFQTADATVVETRALPDGIVPEALNPDLAQPRQGRTFLRLGRWESERGADATIAGYWSATPDGPDILRRQNRAWEDGEGEVNWIEPWSAAFVSWVMCEAGLGDMGQFQRDIAHRTYIDQAIRARDGQAPEAAYAAHDIGETEVEPGDLLCNARGSEAYRTIADRRPDMGEFAPTHCDIVVRVDAEAGRIAIIGGNVVNGVTLTLLPATREGSGPLRPLIEADIIGGRRLFAHLKLRADPVEPNALDHSPTVRALSG